MSEGSNLRGLFRGAHARGWMARHGVWDLVAEVLAHMAILEDEGTPVTLRQHGKSYESWSLAVGGRVYHLRVQPSPYGPRENAIYLKDAWRNGNVVAVWRNVKDVRLWFDAVAA